MLLLVIAHYSTITPDLPTVNLHAAPCGIGSFFIACAAVAELVDALDSKSCVHLDVPVQVRPAVPAIKKILLRCRSHFLVIAN